MSVHTFSADENNLDKKTLNSIYYINIKSEELQNILKIVLRDICTINLNKDKSAV